MRPEPDPKPRTAQSRKMRRNPERAARTGGIYGCTAPSQWISNASAITSATGVPKIPPPVFRAWQAKRHRVGNRTFRSRPKRPRCRAYRGEVPEWSNGTVSKTVVPSRVPWVRIPPSPPFSGIKVLFYKVWSKSLPPFNPPATQKARSSEALLLPLARARVLVRKVREGSLAGGLGGSSLGASGEVRPASNTSPARFRLFPALRSVFSPQRLHGVL